MAKVKFEAHYNHTTVDPPELVNFIRKEYPNVITDMPDTTMWKLIIEKKMPPTRIVRYCCDELKEGGGEGRFVITGVRWDESSRRKKTRNTVELFSKSKSKKTRELKKQFLNSDNTDKRKMTENCLSKNKRVLNPIIDWTTDEVWEFINHFNIKYSSLYDQGFDRLGCIGCPMSGTKGMKKDFKRWPKYRENYIRSFEKMLKERKKSGLETEWNSGEDVLNWWIGSDEKKKHRIKVSDSQMELFG